MKPPTGAPACTNHRIEVTAWIPRGDTMVRLGGTSVETDLRNRTRLETSNDFLPYDRLPREALALPVYQRAVAERARAQALLAAGRRCASPGLAAHGCTAPVVSASLSSSAIRTLGESVYHQIETDDQDASTMPTWS